MTNLKIRISATSKAKGGGFYRLGAGLAALASATALVSAQPAWAQQSNADDTNENRDIVVVGSLTDFSVDAKDIEQRQANDLADIFRYEPSVTVGGSLGIAQKIYVRGLEDTLLNVTVDGAPQRGTLFHHIGRVSIEPELLETVEVQAGAGEATAGFGAIGGAIRFRTRNATDMLENGATVGGIAKAGWFSNDGYKLSGTIYGRLTGDLGLLASFVHVDRSAMEDGGSNVLTGTAAKQQLGFVKLSGGIAPGHHISLSYEHRNEEAAFGQRPNWRPLAGARLFPAEGKRQTSVLNYQIDTQSGVDIEATGYWTRSRFVQDRFDTWGRYGATISTYGFDLRGRYKAGDHNIVAGGEYRNDHVASEYLDDVSRWGPFAWSAAVGRFVEKGDAFGLYIQDHWQIADPLLLSFGLRYDAYDLTLVTYPAATDSDGLSWNAGFNFEIIDGLKLNAGYSQAFRGKEIGDAFTLEHRPGRLALSPTLKPERVENIEGGFSFDRNGFRASAVYYDMKIKDVILDQIGRGAFPQDSFYYENVGSFTAKGFELRAGYGTDQFYVDAYFNRYRAKINGDTVEGYEHIGLGNSVGDNWNVRAGWTPSTSFSFEAAVTRFNDLNDIEVLQRNVALGFIGSTQFVDKPGYTIVDLSARWQPFGNDKLTLQAAVYNLFDKLYRHHASVADYSAIPDYELVAGVNEPGRNIRLGATFKF